MLKRLSLKDEAEDICERHRLRYHDVEAQCEKLAAALEDYFRDTDDWQSFDRLEKALAEYKKFKELK